MSLENELKKLNDAKQTSMNVEFKKNLRSYLINEYRKEYKPSFMGSIVNFFRFQSALNLSIITIFFVSVGTVASYVAIPEDLRTVINNYVTSKSEYSFASNVENAQVFLNGELIGNTPLRYSLKEGNYSVRIEKDGYEIYTDSFEVVSNTPSQVFAELNKLPENSPYAGWLKYKNDEANLSFYYPADWKISENISSSDYSDFSINLSFNGGSIDLKYNTENGLNFDGSENIESFKKVLVGGLSRYLQFKDSGEFVYGGAQILSSNGAQNVLALYSFGSSKEDVFSSNELKLMDQLLESIVIGDSNSVVAITTPAPVASVEESVDLSDSDSTADIIASSNLAVKIDLPNVYSNRVYDFSLQYPENWRIYDTRANYPIEDKGVTVYKDGVNFKVAQLRIKSADSGSMYINFAIDDSPLFDNDSNICSSSSNIIKSFGGYNLVKSNMDTSEYGYQICRGLNGTLASGTGVSYSVFWDVEPEEFSINAANEVVAIVKSMYFEKLTGALAQENQTNNDYSIATLGIALDVSGYDVQTLSCGTGCFKTQLYKNSTLVMTFSDRLLEDVRDEYVVKTSRDIAGYNFKEYYTSICDSDNVCLNEYKFSTYTSPSLTIVYHTPVNDDIVRIVSSIKPN